MIKSLIILLLVAAAGVWYWKGPYQEESRSAEEKRFEENARTMDRCVRREESMNAAAGMGAVGGLPGDSKTLCAEKHGLYFAEGRWRKLGAVNNEY